MRGLPMEFQWDSWNLDHVILHGVTPEETEAVVRRAARPFPRDIGEGKQVVWGRGSGGRLLQVIFVPDSDGTLRIIHARPLSAKEKHQWRKTRR
jgi:uncharacterized DUF497 family protein